MTDQELDELLALQAEETTEDMEDQMNTLASHSYSE
jgi:hypothetical protein